MKLKKQPEILFAEDGPLAGFPFYETKGNDGYAKLLHIFHLHTSFDELSEGSDPENAVPVQEATVRAYIDTEFLANVLGMEAYDKVRIALGLDPVEEARRKGVEISEDIAKNVQEINESTELKNQKNKKTNEVRREAQKRMEEKQKAKLNKQSKE